MEQDERMRRSQPTIIHVSQNGGMREAEEAQKNVRKKIYARYDLDRDGNSMQGGRV